MHRTIAVLLLLLLLLLPTGCKLTRETEDIAFIVTMGIDTAPNDMIKVTYRIEIPRAAGSSTGLGQDVEGGPVLTQSIIAPNIAEAFNLLGTTMSRFANRTHMKIILFGEALARQGIEEQIAPLVRYREYHGSIFVGVVKGEAEAFLRQNNPRLDYLPSKFWESFLLNSDQSGYFDHPDIHQFYLRLKNPGASPYAAYMALNPLTGEKKPGEPIPHEKAEGVKAGDLGRSSSETPVEIAGAAVFSGGKMVGVLDTREVRTLTLLQNRLSQGFFTPIDPLAPDKQINITLRNGQAPDIDVKMEDGREVIRISVFLEGAISAIPSGIHYEQPEYRERLEQEVSRLIQGEIERFVQDTQRMGSDVLGFGMYLRRNYNTYSEIETINFENLYKNADLDVHVVTKIRRTGLMWKSSPYAPHGAENN